MARHGKSYATVQEFEGRRENFFKAIKVANAKKQELYEDSRYVNTDSCHPWHVGCTEDHGLVYDKAGQDAKGKSFCELKAAGMNVAGRLTPATSPDNLLYDLYEWEYKIHLGTHPVNQTTFGSSIDSDLPEFFDSRCWGGVTPV